MPQLGWLEALRQYNAGMPSWCIPRKGTPAYEMITRIRQGEKPKSFKELTEELERKTGGKPKAEKKSMSISLTEDRVEVPVADSKTDASSTKKMSQQKTMAVIQPTYAAEEGSQKKVAKLKTELASLVAERKALDHAKKYKAFHDFIDNESINIRSETRKASFWETPNPVIQAYGAVRKPYADLTTKIDVLRDKIKRLEASK